MTTPGTSNKPLGLTFPRLIIPPLEKKQGLRNVVLRLVFECFRFKYMTEKMLGEQLLPDFASSFPFAKNASCLRDNIKRKRRKTGSRAYRIPKKTTQAIIFQLFSIFRSRTQHYGLGY